MTNLNPPITDLAADLRRLLSRDPYDEQIRALLTSLIDICEQNMDVTVIPTILNLLKEETIEVEPGDRVYVSSPTYGKSRYHMLNNKQDCIQIEQTNIDEKWPSRITIYDDELPKVLKTLLTWHLEAVKQQQASTAQTDDLGDIDAHPF